MSYPYLPNNEDLVKHYIYDYRTGDVIDPITGEVVDRIYVCEVFRRDRESGSLVPAYATLTFSNPMHPLHLTRSKYECFVDIIDYLDVLRKETGIVVSDYEVILTTRHVLKKLGRHPHTEEFKLAVLYIVLEMLKIPIDENTLVSLFGVSKHKLRSEIMKLKRELLETGFKMESKGSLVDRIVAYINLYGRKLGLPNAVILSAVRVAQSKPYPSRFTPRSIAIAILYFEIERHNIDITSKVENCYSTLKALMKLLGVSQNIAKVVKFVEKYYYGGGASADKD